MAYMHDAALLTVTRAWGARQGMKGNKGGWISRQDHPSVSYQGWFSVWARHKAEILDELTQELTAFDSFNTLVRHTHASYRPSIRIRTARERVLADAYDMAQERRSDPRRAYRSN